METLIPIIQTLLSKNNSPALNRIKTANGAYNSGKSLWQKFNN